MCTQGELRQHLPRLQNLEQRRPQHRLLRGPHRRTHQQVREIPSVRRHGPHRLQPDISVPFRQMTGTSLSGRTTLCRSVPRLQVPVPILHQVRRSVPHEPANHADPVVENPFRGRQRERGAADVRWHHLPRLGEDGAPAGRP